MLSFQWYIRSGLVAIGTCWAAHSGLAAQPAEGETRWRAGAAEITLGGRVQTQFNTSTAAGAAASETILRRVRLSVTVRVNETVSGRFQPEFAGDRVQLADAYLQLTLSPALNFMAGRAYRPFAIMEQTSNTQTIPIERGLGIRGVSDLDLSALLSGRGYTDRDVGFQLRGAPTGAPRGLSYALGAFAGPVQGLVGERFTQQYVGRLSALAAPQTRVGAAISRRDFARAIPAGDPDLRPGTAFVVDLEHGGPTPAPGLHLLAEAATGDFDPFTGADFSGGQLWLGYRITANGPLASVEPLVRVSHASVDRPDGVGPRGGTLLTPGLNLYFGGLNRVMFNYDLWNPTGGSREGSFRTQFQLAF